VELVDGIIREKGSESGGSRKAAVLHDLLVKIEEN
jgi:hypothetical protein